MSFTPLKSSFPPPEIELPGFVLPAVLPDDVGALKSLLQAQQDEIVAIRQQAMQPAMQLAMREAHDYIIRMALPVKKIDRKHPVDPWYP